MNIKCFLLLSIFFFILSGCVPADNNTPEPNSQHVHQEWDSESIQPVSKVDLVYTAEKKLSLTFNGLPTREKLNELLSLLEANNIKATFFVPGQRVAVEPDLIQLILKHGHEIENNSLNKINMNSFTYDQIYNELKLGKQTIENVIEHDVKYVRTETLNYEQPVLKAAAHSEHERYIGYSLFLTDEYIDSIFSKPSDLRIYINRGAIIAIDLDRNEKIEEMLQLLVPAVEEVHYQFVTIDELLAAELPKRPYYEIEGYELAKINDISPNQKYHVFEKGNPSKKQIALTIDDWGTDYTITKMLDILKEKEVKATFFIRTNGAERNPGLARAIFDDGHEIANHTYSHPVITSISAKELQEEVVKSHHILTEAIQHVPSMYFRPPTGRVDDATAQIVAATGYTEIVLYDITTYDWLHETTADDIIRIITSEVTNGSIILLHMLDDIHTLEALPIVIDRLKNKGYEFVTTTEMMQ